MLFKYCSIIAILFLINGCVGQQPSEQSDNIPEKPDPTKPKPDPTKPNPDPTSEIKKLLVEAAKPGAGATAAIAKVWEIVREADFAKKDDKRDRALEVLKLISEMAPSAGRKEISKALATKSDMVATSSGLLQSMVQGPIDADIVKIVSVLIDDQDDAATKKAFLGQKLGSLAEEAMYYLLNLNISGAAPGNGPGVRLDAGALQAEEEYLIDLIALFLKNRAGLSMINAEGTQAEIVRFGKVLDLLYKHNHITDYIRTIFVGRSWGQDDIKPTMEWIAAKEERLALMKPLMAILEDSTEKDNDKKMARKLVQGVAVEIFISQDLETTVRNNAPIKKGGTLGFGAEEFYEEPVALSHFLMLLEKSPLDFRTLTNTDFAAGDFGTSIWLLVTLTGIDTNISVSKKKAVIRTIAKKLKSYYSPQVWRDMLVLESEQINQSAIDSVMHDLRITEKEAKKLLLYN